MSELRHGREYRAACAAYDVFIIRWQVWIDNRLRGTVRTGKFFGHGIAQKPLIRAAERPFFRSENRRTGQNVPSPRSSAEH